MNCYYSDMKMDVDDEGTKNNESSGNIRAPEDMEGENSQEQFEQNSNTSHQSYDRNGNIYLEMLSTSYYKLMNKDVCNFS